jgi:hypothetical protein
MFQPRNWSFVAITSCDQPFFIRHFRTCWPIKFLGMFVTASDSNADAPKTCVHTNTTTPKCHIFSLASFWVSVIIACVSVVLKLLSAQGKFQRG